MFAQLATSSGLEYIPTPDHLILVLDAQGGLQEITEDLAVRALAEEVRWWDSYQEEGEGYQ